MSWNDHCRGPGPASSLILPLGATLAGPSCARCAESVPLRFPPRLSRARTANGFLLEVPLRGQLFEERQGALMAATWGCCQTQFPGWRSVLRNRVLNGHSLALAWIAGE